MPTNRSRAAAAIAVILSASKSSPYVKVTKTPTMAPPGSLAPSMRLAERPRRLRGRAERRKRHPHQPVLVRRVRVARHLVTEPAAHLEAAARDLLTGHDVDRRALVDVLVTQPQAGAVGDQLERAARRREEQGALAGPAEHERPAAPARQVQHAGMLVVQQCHRGGALHLLERRAEVAE